MVIFLCPYLLHSGNNKSTTLHFYAKVWRIIPSVFVRPIMKVMEKTHWFSIFVWSTMKVVEEKHLAYNESSGGETKAFSF